MFLNELMRLQIIIIVFYHMKRNILRSFQYLGRLLDEIFKHMDNKRQGKPIANQVPENVKMVIFPAPHMVLATLIGIFSGSNNKLEQNFYPHIGAMFKIELHKSCDGKVWYFKVTDYCCTLI